MWYRLAGETHIFTEDSARFIHGHGRAFKNQKWQAFYHSRLFCSPYSYSVHMGIYVLTQWPHILFSICLFGIRYITNFQPAANFLPLCNALCWGDLSKVCLRNGGVFEEWIFSAFYFGSFERSFFLKARAALTIIWYYDAFLVHLQMSVFSSKFYLSYSSYCWVPYT